MVEPFTMMRDGGFFMWPILITGLFAAAICVERLFFVLFRAHINAAVFMGRIQKLVVADNLDSAVKMCNAEPHAALPRVVKAGLMRAHLSEQDIQSAVDEALLEVAPLVSRRTPYLTMLANVATLLGLLGTIGGLTTAFSAVGAADPAHRSAFLAAGIAEALHTTSFGLLIAVPTLVIHSYLTSRVEGVMDQVDELSVRLLRVLERRAAGRITGQGEAA